MKKSNRIAKNDLPPQPVPLTEKQPENKEQAFAFAIQRAITSAQASGVDQAFMLGVLRIHELNVEAPFQLMARKSAEQWYAMTQQGNG